jgi:SAM-dependent methyltransferase
MTSHRDEVVRGRRFEFGRNWQRFLELLDDDRITRSTESLRSLLGVADLRGRTFLDIGSGSGLFSLAARRLGADVRSFDYDPASVACTTELRRRYFPDDPRWSVTSGSVLDRAFLDALGSFDVVYSWGVLHHTGQMWTAIENASRLVRAGGLLAIAIYNDQGAGSRRWLFVKKLYNRCPKPLRFLVLWPAAARLWVKTLVADALRGNPLKTWREYREHSRGMDPWRDIVDWVGGYPFEVASREALTKFAADLGFTRVNEISIGIGHGCNELVFRRNG